MKGVCEGATQPSASITGHFSVPSIIIDYLRQAQYSEYHKVLLSNRVRVDNMDHPITYRSAKLRVTMLPDLVSCHKSYMVSCNTIPEPHCSITGASCYIVGVGMELDALHKFKTDCFMMTHCFPTPFSNLNII
jgi:hypothetical protein